MNAQIGNSQVGNPQVGQSWGAHSLRLNFPAACVYVTGLSAAQMTKVKTLRDEGMSLHKSGKHGASIKALHEATHILGVEPYKPS